MTAQAKCTMSPIAPKGARCDGHGGLLHQLLKARMRRCPPGDRPSHPRPRRKENDLQRSVVRREVAGQDRDCLRGPDAALEDFLDRRLLERARAMRDTSCGAPPRICMSECPGAMTSWYSESVAPTASDSAAMPKWRLPPGRSKRPSPRAQQLKSPAMTVQATRRGERVVQTAELLNPPSRRRSDRLDRADVQRRASGAAKPNCSNPASDIRDEGAVDVARDDERGEEDQGPTRTGALALPAGKQAK